MSIKLKYLKIPKKLQIKFQVFPGFQVKWQPCYLQTKSWLPITDVQKHLLE